jgi:hypothetical protein
MCVSLHQHPILPPTLPLVRAEGGDVPGGTLGLVLEVVAADARWVPAHVTQHMEAAEQAHQQSHSHEHLIEVMKITTRVMECGDRC